MAVEFSVQSVREGKGAALAVLVLLSLVSLPVSQEGRLRMRGLSGRGERVDVREKERL